MFIEMRINNIVFSSVRSGMERGQRASWAHVATELRKTRRNETV